MSENKEFVPTPGQLRNRLRRMIFFVGVFFIALTIICGLTIFLIRDSFDSRREPRAVMAGAEVQTLVELPGEDAFPRSIVVGPDNNLYVSGFCNGKIWQVTTDGQIEEWYDGDDIDAASGIAFDLEGNLFVADGGDCDPREGTYSLKKIIAEDKSVEFIPGIDREDIPQSLLVDPTTGTLYFADAQNKRIRYLNEQNEIITWWDVPDVDDDSRPTGLAYDSFNDALIVGDTESGTLYRVRFDSDRSPLPEEIIYQDDERDINGLTITDDGTIIVTLYNVNRVGRIIDGEMRIVAEEFREPYDVVFLDNSIYVTNFDGVSLAPLIGFFVEPSLPFTVDEIILPTPETPMTPEAEATSEAAE